MRDFGSNHFFAFQFILCFGLENSSFCDKMELIGLNRGLVDSDLDDSVVVHSSFHLVFPKPLKLFLTEGSSDIS